MQREIILAALDKQDIFLQAATSFGKSLCFQLPAVIDHGSESPRSLPKKCLEQTLMFGYSHRRGVASSGADGRATYMDIVSLGSSHLL